MKAILKNIRISPKKANVVAGITRGMMVTEALNQLRFTPKKAARILYKVIQSAAANAETNFKQNRDKLYVERVIVTPGPTYRRGVSISRGRVHPIRKRTSHITVYVNVKVPTATAKPKKAESTPKPKAD